MTFDEWLPEVSPHLNWNFKHLKYTRSFLEPILRGERKHIIVMFPPQNGKSEQVTTHFPAYYLWQNPEKRIIIGAYNHDFATNFSLKIRRLLSNDKSFSFGDKYTAKEWNTSKGGFIKAFGLQSGITGTSADLIIIDDPVKSFAEAQSKVIREKIWNGFVYDIETREQKNTSYIVILTHWHCDDLAGRLIARDGNKWQVICLPALAKENDPLGREIDEALCEELHPKARLLERRELTPTMFAAMYQQSPVIDSGNIFKLEDWQYYSLKPNFTRVVQSWDTAFKAGENNDYSVCVTIGERENGYYIINVLRKKLQYPELKKMVVAQYEEHRPSTILIEDKASGQSLVQDLIRTRLPVKPIGVDKDKVVRANVVSGLVEAKKVFLPESAPWLADFYEETSTFPNGTHDDIIDSLTMALTYLSSGRQRNIELMII